MIRFRVRQTRRTWPCEGCGAVFYNQATLKVHVRSHKGSTPYVCEICGQRFVALPFLHMHMRAHPGLKVKDSGKECDEFKKVKDSVCRRTGELAYRCGLCFKLFVERKTAVRHLQKFHRIYRTDVRNKNILPVYGNKDVGQGFSTKATAVCGAIQEESCSDGLEKNAYITTNTTIYSHKTSSDRVVYSSCEKTSTKYAIDTIDRSVASSGLEFPVDQTGPISNLHLNENETGDYADRDGSEAIDQIDAYGSDVNTSKPVLRDSAGLPGENPCEQDWGNVSVNDVMCVKGSKDSELGVMVMALIDSRDSEKDVGQPVFGDFNEGELSTKVKTEVCSGDEFKSVDVWSADSDDTDISDGEWEKLSLAFAESHATEVQSALISTEEHSLMGTEDHSSLRGTEEHPSFQTEEETQNTHNIEPVSPEVYLDHPDDEPDDPLADDNHEMSISSKADFESASDFCHQVMPRQFTDRGKTFTKAAIGGEVPRKKTKHEGYQQKSWTSEYRRNLMTNRRKNALTKIFNWKAYTKVDAKQKQPLKCHICDGSFVDEASLKEHMSRHEGTKTHYLKCSQCPKVFSSKYTLSMHERIHAEYRPFHCKICGKGFYQRANIKVHMRAHTGERPFKCEICDKAYSVKLSLAAHSRTHTEENKFACDKCKFCFSNEEDLIKHQKVHAYQKSHECHRCKKKFLKAYLLEFHLQRDCEDKRYSCDQCNKHFTCFDYLKVHQRVHTGEKPFGCEVCGKFFSQSANLSKHLKIHNNIRSFECDICKQTFIEKASMIAHRRIHTGEKPHMCDVCGVAFSSPSSLVVHLRVHTGERPYACEMCDKTFTSSGKLRDHVRTHTGEKPYKCKICDKSFALSNGLVRHTRIHTGERPHECDICGERFMRKDRLRKHMGGHVKKQVDAAWPQT
ncbi:zinc finger protein 699-like [Haliotis rufescens]|uniref:zinc finger protein 699-like n=1 Tax=Haliotis rufescens TaxID=6454 RepID=UPI00201F3467|nr:zinc finger protein 699-like [Haliotis rufescens]XP_048244671.1 zinc finger protein 699-like [Haliotis rufescens]